MNKSARQQLFLHNNPNHFISQEITARKDKKIKELYTAQTIKRVLQLWNKGQSVRKIIKEVNMPRSTVYYIIKKYEHV